VSKAFPKFYFRDRQHFVDFLTDAPDDLVASTIYTSQIGRVFTVLALVEDTLVHALWMCENVKVDGQRKPLPNVREYEKRRGLLKDQSFGNLLQVLRQNGISEESLEYLRFLKRIRDRFIHRFFEENAWPGDLRSEWLLPHSRTLAAYEIILNRANHRIWKILGKEIFHEMADFGKDGLLIMNDIGRVLDEADDSPSA